MSRQPTGNISGVISDQADVSYATVITARGNSNRMDLAEETLRIALARNQAGVATFASMITAAGNHNRMNLAEVAFRIALTRNQVNVVTLNSMITAAGNNNRMDLAEEAFQIALASNQTDAATFGNIYDARQKNPPPVLTTRYRHNPYSFLRSWEADNTASPSAAIESDHVTPPRQG